MQLPKQQYSMLIKVNTNNGSQQIVKYDFSPGNHDPILKMCLNHFLYHTTAIEQAASSPTSTTTPTLPQFNPLASFTPEQIQQLAFLQYLQNFGGFGGFPNVGSSPFNQAQEIITSSPVYRTETLFATSTIPLFQGAKKFFTTLTQSIGVTTVTDYDVVTVSPSQQDNNPFGAMFPQQGKKEFCQNNKTKILDEC